jgi:toxin ParE1/3/4
MKITWSPAALRDLRSNYLYLCDQGSPQNAWAQYQRLYAYREKLGELPSAGVAHDELQLGLRTRPFEAFVFAYRVSAGSLRILRVVHHARDYTRVLARKR